MTSFLALLRRALWETDPASVGKAKGFLVRSLRFLFLISRALAGEQFALRAMGLVYTTLLSLVPLLAVSFSVLKAFGVHAKAEVILYQFLEPLGTKGVELSVRIIQFVENVKASVLGSIGLIMLMYTVVTLIHQMERAMNYIWRVKATRSFAKRLSNYMSFILVGPVVVFSIAGIVGSVMSTEFVRKIQAVTTFGGALYVLGKAAPFVLICGVFTLLYLLLPNTRVRVGPALKGGLLAASLWVLTGWLFTYGVVSTARYSAIYSGFATLILFLIWLYWSFLIVFAGAWTAWYAQCPHAVVKEADDTASVAGTLRVQIALRAMISIGRHFYTEKIPCTLDILASRMGVPHGPLGETLDMLVRADLLFASGDEAPGYVPARDPGRIRIDEIIQAVADPGDELSCHHGDPSSREVEKTMARVRDAVSQALASQTLKDLLPSDEVSSGRP
jgi:membrane protein